MTEHPPTSIDIDSEIFFYDSTLTSRRNESLKISIVTPQNYKSVLPSGETTLLQKNPNTNNTKNHPIKKIIPKPNKFTQYFEADI